MQRTTKAFLRLTSALAVIHAAPAFAQQAPSDPAVGAAAPSAPVAAPASATSASQLGGAGDIVVTARRTEERLQDVPISITVFNQQQLNSRNIVAAADLATYTPSLSTNSFFGSNNTNFSIRGFNQQFGTSPTVGVYFADVVAPRGASNNIPVGDGAGPGSFFDLQNVQVLKGPQGTLFGLNTTGGAVLLVPQKPTDKFEGYVEGSYGNYDMKRIQGVVNIPAGKARFRFGVDHQSRDGYLINHDPVGPKDFDDVNYTAVRASMDVDLTPDLENYTIVSYTHSNTHGDLQALYVADPAACGQLAASAAQAAGCSLGVLAQAERARYGSGFYTTGNWVPDPHTTLTQWQIVNTTTWQASDSLTIKNIASYAQLKEDIVSSLFGTYLDLYDFGIYPAVNQGIIGLAQVVPIPGGNTANQSTFTEELQLQGHGLGGRLQYQGGAYFELSDPLGLVGSISQNTLVCTAPASTICANPLGAGSVSTTIGRTSYKDVGLYSQATYSFTDKLKLTGGIRYTWDHEKLDGAQTAYQYAQTFVPGPPLISPASPNGYICGNPEQSLPSCAYSFREKSSAPTWLIDLDYKPIQNMLIYAKYSRGYRAGGISGGVPVQYSTFGPEKLDAYEVGLKTSFHGAVSGSLNVAGFYNDFRHEQTIVSFYPKVTGTQQQESAVANADKSRSYGAEVEAILIPFRGFTLDASYAYTNAKITRIPAIVLPADSPLFPVSAAQDGDLEQFVPKNKYTINGTYVLPLDAGVGKVSIGATFTHFDSQIAQYSARDAITGGLLSYSIIGPRNLVDLSMGWTSIAGSPFDLQLFATNITKEKYYTDKAGLFTSTGLDMATVGAPRTYGARLRFHFGT